MGKEFYIEILKPVPKKFCQDKVFDESEINAAGLEHTFNTKLIDKYHVKVKVRFVYTGMDDVAEYLGPKVPNADWQNWSMSPSFRSYHCCGKSHDGNNWSYDLSDKEYEALKRPHISDVIVMKREMACSVQDYNGEWLSDKCPIYITKSSIKQMLDWYLEYLKQTDTEDLLYEIQRRSGSSNNIFRAICSAFAYAKQKGGIACIEWE